jgi:hypothetical protein
LLMANGAAVDVPPPGAGFVTVTFTVPAVARPARVRRRPRPVAQAAAPLATECPEIQSESARRPQAALVHTRSRVGRPGAPGRLA